MLSTQTLKNVVLIETHFTNNINYEKEIVNQKGNYYIVGEHALLDEPNENNRIYKRNIIEKEIKRLKDLGCFERRNIIARLEHPISEKELPNSFLNGCAVFTDMWIEKNNNKTYLYAKSIILDENFYGKELLGLIKKGVKPGASTRGVGSLIPINESNGIYEVADDFILFTIDYVSEPSGRVYPSNIIYERKNHNYKKYLSISDKLYNILQQKKYIQ